MADTQTPSIVVGLDFTRALNVDLPKAAAQVSRIFNAGARINNIAAPLGKISGNVSEFTKSLESANARVLAFGASVSIFYTIQKALETLVTSTIDVQKALQDINVILGQDTQSLAKFSDELFKIGNNTGQSFDTITKSALEFSRQGLGAAETLKRVKDAAILMRLTNLSAEESTSALTAAVNSFQHSLLDTTEVVNKFAAVDAKFAVSSADLAEGLKRAGSSASDAGISIDELIGLITTAQQVTSRGGAVIGNAIKTILQRTGRSETIEQLQNLGIAIDSSQNGIEKLKAIATGFDGASKSTQNFIKELAGGGFQINQLSAILNNITGQYSLYERSVKTAGQASNEATSRNIELNKTLAAQINELKNNAIQAFSKLGDITIAGPLKDILGLLNTGLSGLSGKSEGFGSDIGKGLIKGLGDFLSGPGLTYIGVIGLNLLTRFGKFTLDAVKQLNELGAVNKDRFATEQGIAGILAKEPGLLNQISQGTLTVAQAQAAILSNLQSELLLREKIAATAAAITPGILKSNITFSQSTGTAQRKGTAPKKFAGGLIPTPEEEISESAGAMAQGYRPGKVKVTNIEKLGRVIYNDAEKIVRFPNTQQPAIIPPENSKAGNKYKQDFSKKLGFDPYKNQGLIPNYNAITEFKQADKVTKLAAQHGLAIDIKDNKKKSLTKNDIILKQKENDGLIPNYSVAKKNELGFGADGNFYQYVRRPALGYKEMHFSDDVEREFNNSSDAHKLLSDSPLIDAPKVIGTKERSLKRGGFGKTIVREGDLSNISTKLANKGIEGWDIQKVLSKISRVGYSEAEDRGIGIIDDHQGNIGSHGGLTDFIEKLHKEKRIDSFQNLNFADIKDELLKNNVKLSLLDAGRAYKPNRLVAPENQINKGLVPNFLDISLLKPFRKVNNNLKTGNFNIRDITADSQLLESFKSQGFDKNFIPQGIYSPQEESISLDNSSVTSKDYNLTEKASLLTHEGIHNIIDLSQKQTMKDYAEKNIIGPRISTGLKVASENFTKYEPKNSKLNVNSYLRTKMAGYPESLFMEEAIADDSLSNMKERGILNKYLQLKDPQIQKVNSLRRRLQKSSYDGLIKKGINYFSNEGEIPNYVSPKNRYTLGYSKFKPNFLGLKDLIKSPAETLKKLPFRVAGAIGAFGIGTYLDKFKDQDLEAQQFYSASKFLLGTGGVRKLNFSQQNKTQIHEAFSGAQNPDIAGGLTEIDNLEHKPFGDQVLKKERPYVGGVYTSGKLQNTVGNYRIAKNKKGLSIQDAFDFDNSISRISFGKNPGQLKSKVFHQDIPVSEKQSKIADFLLDKFVKTSKNKIGVKKFGPFDIRKNTDNLLSVSGEDLEFAKYGNPFLTRINFQDKNQGLVPNYAKDFPYLDRGGFASVYKVNDSLVGKVFDPVTQIVKQAGSREKALQYFNETREGLEHARNLSIENDLPINVARTYKPGDFSRFDRHRKDTDEFSKKFGPNVYFQDYVKPSAPINDLQREQADAILNSAAKKKRSSSIMGFGDLKSAPKNFIGSTIIDLIARKNTFANLGKIPNYAPTTSLAKGINLTSDKQIKQNFKHYFENGKDYGSFYDIGNELLSPEQAKQYSSIAAAVSARVPETTGAPASLVILDHFAKTKSTNVDDYLNLNFKIPTRLENVVKSLGLLGPYGIRRKNLGKALRGENLTNDPTSKLNQYSNAIAGDKNAFPVDINVTKAALGEDYYNSIRANANKKGKKMPSGIKDNQILRLQNLGRETAKDLGVDPRFLQAGIFKGANTDPGKYTRDFAVNTFSIAKSIFDKYSDEGMVPNYALPLSIKKKFVNLQKQKGISVYRPNLEEIENIEDTQPSYGYKQITLPRGSTFNTYLHELGHGLAGLSGMDIADEVNANSSIVSKLEQFKAPKKDINSYKGELNEALKTYKIRHLIQKMGTPNIFENEEHEFEHNLHKEDLLLNSDPTPLRKVLSGELRDSIDVFGKNKFKSLVKNFKQNDPSHYSNTLGYMSTFSEGKIPNFNALKQAITREEKSGVPKSLIKVGQNSILKSSANPQGLGVYNLRDEPQGLNQGIKRAFAEGLNPKTYNVPNFVDEPAPFFQRKTSAFKQEPGYQDLLANEAKDLAQIYKSNKVSYTKLNKTIEEISQAFQLTEKGLQDFTSYIKSGKNKIGQFFDKESGPANKSIIPERLLPKTEKPTFNQQSLLPSSIITEAQVKQAEILKNLEEIEHKKQQEALRIYSSSQARGLKTKDLIESGTNDPREVKLLEQKRLAANKEKDTRQYINSGYSSAGRLRLPSSEVNPLNIISGNTGNQQLSNTQTTSPFLARAASKKEQEYGQIQGQFDAQSELRKIKRQIAQEKAAASIKEATGNTNRSKIFGRSDVSIGPNAIGISQSRKQALDQERIQRRLLAVQEKIAKTTSSVPTFDQNVQQLRPTDSDNLTQKIDSALAASKTKSLKRQLDQEEKLAALRKQTVEKQTALIEESFKFKNIFSFNKIGKQLKATGYSGEELDNLKKGVASQNQGRAFNLSFIAPLIGGAVQQAIGDETKGQRVAGASVGLLSNTLGLAATGAAVGGGLPGALIGGGIGIASSIGSVVEALTSKLPELEKEFEKLARAATLTAEATSRFTESTIKLQGVASGEITGVKRSQINTLLSSNRQSLNALPDEFKSRVKEKLVKGDTEDAIGIANFAPVFAQQRADFAKEQAEIIENRKKIKFDITQEYSNNALAFSAGSGELPAPITKRTINKESQEDVNNFAREFVSKLGNKITFNGPEVKDVFQSFQQDTGLQKSVDKASSLKDITQILDDLGKKADVPGLNRLKTNINEIGQSSEQTAAFIKRFKEILGTLGFKEASEDLERYEKNALAVVKPIFDVVAQLNKLTQGFDKLGIKVNDFYNNIARNVDTRNKISQVKGGTETDIKNLTTNEFKNLENNFRQGRSDRRSEAETRQVELGSESSKNIFEALNSSRQDLFGKFLRDIPEQVRVQGGDAQGVEKINKQLGKQFDLVFGKLNFNKDSKPEQFSIDNIDELKKGIQEQIGVLISKSNTLDKNTNVGDLIENKVTSQKLKESISELNSLQSALDNISINFQTTSRNIEKNLDATDKVESERFRSQIQLLGTQKAIQLRFSKIADDLDSIRLTNTNNFEIGQARTNATAEIKDFGLVGNKRINAERNIGIQNIQASRQFQLEDVVTAQINKIKKDPKFSGLNLNQTKTTSDLRQKINEIEFKPEILTNEDIGNLKELKQTLQDIEKIQSDINAESEKGLSLLEIDIRKQKEKEKILSSFQDYRRAQTVEGATADIATGRFKNSQLGNVAAANFDYGFKDFQRQAVDSVDEVAFTMRNSFSDTVASAIKNGESLKNAFTGYLTTILDKVIDKTSSIGTNILFSGLGSAAKAIGVTGFASGGIVKGGSGVKDDVPAVLTAGEYVLKKETVKKLGLQNLKKIENDPKTVSVNLQNTFDYNDPKHPTTGKFNTSKYLSNFGLSDTEISRTNQIKFGREEEFYSYQEDFRNYQKAKADALKAYKDQKKNRLIGAYISAATGIAGAGLSTAFKGSINTRNVNNALAGRNSYNKGYQFGGLIKKYAEGGGANYTSGIDKVPAMLTNGEYVIKKDKVEKYGSNYFDRINYGYAAGGAIGRTPELNTAFDSRGFDNLTSAINQLNATIIKGPSATDNSTTTTANGNAVNNYINITIDIAENGQVSASSNSSGGNKDKENKTDPKLLSNLERGMKDIASKVINESMKQGGPIRNFVDARVGKG